jgi:Flp pilus assembly protein TadG
MKQTGYKKQKTGLLIGLRSFMRFGRANRGTAAVEFAFIAPVFFGLLFFGLELGIYVFKQNFLKHVLYESNRYITTGKFEDDGYDPDKMREFICERTDPWINCYKVDIDVKRFDSVADVAFDDPVYNEDGRATNFGYDLAGTGNIVGLRMSMPYIFSTKLLQEAVMGDGADNKALVLNFSIAHNEPG